MLEEALTEMSDDLPTEAKLDPLPTSSQRQFMQRLRTDKWRRLVTVSVAAGPGLLSRLATNGWIEQGGQDQDIEVRLTHAGLNALRAKMA